RWCQPGAPGRRWSAPSEVHRRPDPGRPRASERLRGRPWGTVRRPPEDSSSHGSNVRPVNQTTAPIAAITQIPPFTEFSEAEMAELLPRVQRRSYRADETIFREGDPPAFIYYVVSGEINLTLTSEERRISVGKFSAVRLAKRILELAEAAGPGRSAAAVKVTQKELSELAGATRGGVNRALKRLEHLGLVKISRGTITVVAPDRLRRLAQQEPLPMILG